MHNAKLPLHKRLNRKVRDIRLGIRKWRGARARNRNDSTFYIGITGSAGKSTAAALLGHVLSGHGKTHSQVFSNTIRPIARSLYRQPRGTKWSVNELGMTEQGSIGQMAKLVRPQCAIVTTVGLDHYKNFRCREAIAEEKGGLVEALRPGGMAILNADDENVVTMRNRTSEKVVTFGRSNSADYFATDISTTMASGLSLTLKGPSTDLKIRTHFTGEHFWVSIAAAAVAALEMGIDQKMVQQRMASFQPVWDRCHPFHTPDGPTFLVDTCKAPLYSLDLAFSTLASAQGTKKIVVGQLADHPGNSKMAARKARRLAEARADELIFVGHSAKRLGLSDRELASGRYSLFERIKELTCYLKETATEDDVILLKSASILHLERVAMAWTTHVRCWKERCGKDGSCMKCGRYGLSYSVHRGVLPKKICRVIANRLNEREQNTADSIMVRH